MHCVIETPMGSRNKFKFDEEIGSYALSGVLPQGMMFPHAFGFIPGTKAADGDPEDVLVIMDLPVFTGCVVPSRLIGVIEAEQTEDGETDRNDRLLAVAAHSKDYSDVNSLKDLNGTMLKEIEQFFVNYNKEKGKEVQSSWQERSARSHETAQKELEVSWRIGCCRTRLSDTLKNSVCEVLALMKDILTRFLIGGAVVSTFATMGDLLKPKSFAGLFGAAPAVALATLTLTVGAEGRSMLQPNPVR